MVFVVTHPQWGVLARPSVPAEWVPWSVPGAIERATRFPYRIDAVRALCGTWGPSVRSLFRIVAIDERTGREPPPPPPLRL
jgi:hypothetical protein